MNEKTVPYKTVRKTVPINNCFKKPAGQELSFVSTSIMNKIVTASVAPTCCELANRG